MDQAQLILQGSIRDFDQLASFGGPGGSGERPASLLGRLAPLPVLWDHLLDIYGTDLFARQISGPLRPEVEALDRRGRPLGTCLNLASQDYLGLSYDPVILEAARQAIAEHGVHAAGSPALVGNTAPSVRLERALSRWLGMPEVLLFPTGWGACFGAIRGLVKRTDHVVIDRLAHASLQEGARAATPNVRVFEHLDVDSLTAQLTALRAEDPRGGVMVVTESLYSMDADVPDLRAHQEVARRFGAVLLVDVAHDLGVLGPNGLGALETQGMLDEVDLVVGSLSKAFAANGGFVAGRAPGLALGLRFGAGPATFSTGLSPIQAFVALRSLELVQSDEGARRRAHVLALSQHLRSAVESAGFVAMGQPCALVPVMLGGVARCRLAARFLAEQGVLVNLVEYPAVAKDATRLRVQLMASHERDHLETCVREMRKAVERADAMLAELNAGRPGQTPLS